MVIYVFGNEGGRPRSDDIHAFAQFSAAYDILPESLFFILNKTPESFGHEDQAEFLALIRQNIDVRYGSVPALFLPHLGLHPSFSRSLQLRGLILGALHDRVPTHHTRKKALIFNREAVSALTVEMDRLEDQRKQDTRRWAEQSAALREQISAWQEMAERNFQMALAIEGRNEEEKDQGLDWGGLIKTVIQVVEIGASFLA